jgi:hypothetical protein
VSAAPLANSTADGLFSSPRQMQRYLPCRSKVSTGSGLPSLWPSAPRRPPDHVRENSALAALVSAVADSPRLPHDRAERHRRADPSEGDAGDLDEAG